MVLIRYFRNLLFLPCKNLDCEIDFKDWLHVILHYECGSSLNMVFDVLIVLKLTDLYHKSSTAI